MNELKSTIIILATLVVFLTSCEKDIDFNSQYESGIAIYSLVMPGEPFTLRVSRSFSVNDNSRAFTMPTFTFGLISFLTFQFSFQCLNIGFRI